MCFMLYAGTQKPLPRKEWKKHEPDLCIESLTDRDAPIRKHFTLPEVQYIGSTSGCGCDFPHVTLTRGDWIGYLDVEVDDPEWEATERKNREELVKLLLESGEESVELYGVWLSNDADLAKQENLHERIPVTGILDPAFRFKERGLYRVTIQSSSG